MNVFISWSGEQSHAAAIALREWLPNVIQVLKPWMSSADIEAGSRWSRDVETKLSESSFGILCLTPGNLESPWIHFEAGALAKAIKGTKVCPLLFGLEPADIPAGPLTLFQAKVGQLSGFWDLVRSLNDSLPNDRLGAVQLERAFNTWWPHLESELLKLPDIGDGPDPKRPLEEMVAEILGIVRADGRSDFNAALEDFFGVPTSVLLGGKAAILRSIALEVQAEATRHLRVETPTITDIRVVPEQDRFVLMVKEVEGAQGIATVDFDPNDFPAADRVRVAARRVVKAAQEVLAELLADRAYYSTPEGQAALRGPGKPEASDGND